MFTASPGVVFRERISQLTKDAGSAEKWTWELDPGNLGDDCERTCGERGVPGARDDSARCLPHLMPSARGAC